MIDRSIAASAAASYPLLWHLILGSALPALSPCCLQVAARRTGGRAAGDAGAAAQRVCAAGGRPPADRLPGPRPGQRGRQQRRQLLPAAAARRPPGRSILGGGASNGFRRRRSSPPRQKRSSSPRRRSRSLSRQKRSSSPRRPERRCNRSPPRQKRSRSCSPVRGHGGALHLPLEPLLLRHSDARPSEWVLCSQVGWYLKWLHLCASSSRNQSINQLPNT